MLRPCFLVVDREYSGSISTRKLVIETAKFNVITAYSGRECLETLAAFPAISGVVMDAGIEDIPSDEMVVRIKQIQKTLPVIVVRSPRHYDCPGADYVLDSFDPARLLELLRSLEPAKTAVLDAHEENLAG
jgi:DNA-binding response OmpR family regulator